MNSLNNKRILYVDLAERSYEVHNFPELFSYVGGLPLGLKLGEQYLADKPLIFATGPLNGFFPFVSKVAGISLDREVLTFYLGGSLASRIRFADYDALVFAGISEAPVGITLDSHNVSFYDDPERLVESALPGRSSRLLFAHSALGEPHVLLDSYFEAPDNLLTQLFTRKGLFGLVVNATKVFPVPTTPDYKELYMRLLDMGKSKMPRELLPQDILPSCVGCPFGCNQAKVGETAGNVLSHSLVACDLPGSIYSDVGITFACLDSLGYAYTHEMLEAVPSLVVDLYRVLERRI